MYICICKGITDGAIREAVLNGAVRMRDLKQCLGVTEQCGMCACNAKEVLDQVRVQKAGLPVPEHETTCYSGC